MHRVGGGAIFLEPCTLSPSYPVSNQLPPHIFKATIFGRSTLKNVSFIKRERLALIYSIAAGEYFPVKKVTRIDAKISFLFA